MKKSYTANKKLSVWWHQLVAAWCAASVFDVLIGALETLHQETGESYESLALIHLPLRGGPDYPESGFANYPVESLMRAVLEGHEGLEPLAYPKTLAEAMIRAFLNTTPSSRPLGSDPRAENILLNVLGVYGPADLIRRIVREVAEVEGARDEVDVPSFKTLREALIWLAGSYVAAKQALDRAAEGSE